MGRAAPDGPVWKVRFPLRSGVFHWDPAFFIWIGQVPLWNPDHVVIVINIATMVVTMATMAVTIVTMHIW